MQRKCSQAKPGVQNEYFVISNRFCGLAWMVENAMKTTVWTQKHFIHFQETEKK